MRQRCDATDIVSHRAVQATEEDRAEESFAFHILINARSRFSIDGVDECN
jgi:hypothetical protein